MKLGALIAGPDPLVFAAEDGGGRLDVSVPGILWEAFQAEAPGWMDAEDRRDYALTMIEVRLVDLVVEDREGMRSVRLE